MADETGRLHFLYKGAISLGSIQLGEGVGIIATPIEEVNISPKTPFRPISYDLNMSILASVPHDRVDSSHPAIVAGLSDISPTSEGASTVFRLSIKLPDFPSNKVSMLATASTSIRNLLKHAFEAFDEARKGWEEVRGLGNKWLDRLKDDDSASLLPELQLAMLLLTGRPSNTNMHEYFASKNTERVSERAPTTKYDGRVDVPPLARI